MNELEQFVRSIRTTQQERYSIEVLEDCGNGVPIAVKVGGKDFALFQTHGDYLVALGIASKLKSYLAESGLQVVSNQLFPTTEL